jgi:S-adenosylmethionine:tRNA ribosyltransferase-isomerase
MTTEFTHDLDLMDAYDFALPEELIAAVPAPQRSESRLLDARGDAIRDARITDLVDLLSPGDLLVFNDARVSPVRLHASRASGGKVEVFVVGIGREGAWDGSTGEPAIAMTRSSKKLRAGEVLAVLGSAASLRVHGRADDGAHWLLAPTKGDIFSLLDEAGDTPLPPYILARRQALGLPEVNEDDATRYQTVFARVPGAVAAPTAGLHFDDALLARLNAAGIRHTFVTLWVGAGTFKPVKSERLSDHEMHEERFEISAEAAGHIAETRRRGGRVIAVGTTVVRTLEAACTGDAEVVASGSAATRILIRPGHVFRAVDALVTNFHLPRSTLLALVAAMAGRDRIMQVYTHAIAGGYRFFSYGDAMLISTNKEAS